MGFGGCEDACAFGARGCSGEGIVKFGCVGWGRGDGGARGRFVRWIGSGSMAWDGVDASALSDGGDGERDAEVGRKACFFEEEGEEGFRESAGGGVAAMFVFFEGAEDDGFESRRKIRMRGESAQRGGGGFDLLD